MSANRRSERASCGQSPKELSPVKMKSAFLLVSMAALFSNAACTSINAWGSKVPMGGAKFAPVPPERVMILFEPPSRPHDQIGIVSSIGGIYASDGDMFKTMQKEAAELGADAIVVRNETSGSIQSNGGVTVIQSQSIGTAYNFPKTSAIAIKYK